jgi:hypothetical protein
MSDGVRMVAAPCVVAWLACRVVKVAEADVGEAVAVAASRWTVAAGNSNGVAVGRSGRGVAGSGSGRRRWSSGGVGGACERASLDSVLGMRLVR